MTTVTLKLAYSPQAVRETAAWYIASGDPSIWIDEVSKWDVSHAAIRLFVLPQSASNRQPCGALVIVQQGEPTHVSHHLIPFGVIANRVFVPVEALLDPDVTDMELGSLLPEGYSYVWHPTAGLIAFEADDSLGIGDLLSFPPPSSRRWDCAQPGIAIPSRLTNLIPEKTLTIETVLQTGKGDIGTQTKKLSELPPSPSEPKSGGMNTTSLYIKRFFAKVVHWIVQQVPERDHGANWINSIGEWAQKHLLEFNSKLNAARHKEIIRLMHLLDSDPDFGLRFAIPFGGDAHRGRATPSAQLTARNIDFQLGHLGGGSAADFWEISPDYQDQLIARYRELANREMRLGRHRRAAYIFAELLNDLHATVGALVGGGHWREASVVYRQRLNNPREAAQCLERGGLWMEAIAVYEECGQHESAGDLYVKLDQVDAANEQYRKAVDKCRTHNDLLSSTRLLEQKLKSVDEAIDEVSSGWPHTPQATHCLREMFQIVGRHGRHKLARERITEIREATLSEENCIELINVLVDTAMKYPDRSVQAQVADCVRALVSRRLPDARKTSSHQLLSAVSRLVPQDRLLGRDCRRFQEPSPDESIVRHPKPNTKYVHHLNKIYLPSQAEFWETATLGGYAIFVATKYKDNLMLSRCSWTDSESPLLWKIEPQFSESPIILAVDPSRPDFVLVHVVGAPTLTSLQEFKPWDRFPFTTKAGAIPGMSSDAIAVARTSHGVSWLLEVRNSHLTLVAIGRRGKQISSEQVLLPASSPDLADNLSVIPVPLHCRSNKVYVGLAHRLLIFDGVKPPKTVEFEQRITSLVGSMPNTRNRVVATFARGGSVLWEDFNGEYVASFADDMLDPIVCINQGGFLIAVTGNYCEVYSTQGRRLQRVAVVKDTSPDPIAVLPGPSANLFGIVSRSGTINVYEIS